MIAQFHNRVGNPDDGGGVPVVPLAAVACRRHPHPAAHRPGGQRSPGERRPSRSRSSPPSRPNGIDYEYLLFPDEGHGFAKPENRLRFYAAAEAFLARHLGGRAQP